MKRARMCLLKGDKKGLEVSVGSKCLHIALK